MVLSWQTIMLLQIVVSSLMTIFSRKLVLSNNRLYYILGVCTYAAVAVMGCIYALLFHGGVTGVPSAEAWIYITIEGICIPASWLLLYKLISIVGASNSTVTSLMNTVVTALLGILLLHEPFTLSFLAGAVLLLVSGYLALTIQADIKHHPSVALTKKVALIVGMVSFYSIGMYCEKKAIGMVGVWDYAVFGWGMQFIGVASICLLLGRSELVHVTWRSVRGGVLLGLMTSVAGVLYIYALSIGTLSQTVVATSGKLGLTMVLAALLLGEHNALKKRLLALALSIMGIALLFV